MKRAINAAIIQDGKILLVKKKDVWILPGGKPEQGELDIDCLQREVQEELSGTNLKDIDFYKRVEGITPYKGYVLEATVYFAAVDGTLHPASAEIGAFEWVRDTDKYSLSDITSKIIIDLKKDKYL